MTRAQTLCVYCRERPVEPKWRPFCSERCRLLDLSRWLDGDYRVAGEPTDDGVGSAGVGSAGVGPTGAPEASHDTPQDETAPNSRYVRHSHDHR